MEQAFILPLPRYSGPHPEEPNLEEEVMLTRQLPIWQSILEKLSEKKISWEQIGAYLPLESEDTDHLLASFTADRNGETLLHLAVLQKQNEWVDFLGKDSKLKQRRNNFGLTPLELAQFLYHEAHIVSLGGTVAACHSHISVESDGAHVKNFCSTLYPIFASIDVFNEVLQCSKKAKENDLIAHEKIWLGIYFDKEIQTGLNPRLSVRHIDEEIGFGVFADQRIPPCAFVGEYTGIVKERKPKEIKDKRYVVRYNCWETGSRKFIIDAETHGNYTRFINHSSEPNLVLQSVYWRGIPRMVFVSSKEIAKGSQLTFDYGRSFWKEMNQLPRQIT